MSSLRLFVTRGRSRRLKAQLMLSTTVKVMTGHSRSIWVMAKMMKKKTEKNRKRKLTFMTRKDHLQTTWFF